jgi:hypothetical protein
LLVHTAAGLPFSLRGAEYPGVRDHFAGDAGALFEPFRKIIAETFGLTDGFDVDESLFALLTTPPQELTFWQRLPHTDGTRTPKLAALLYLCNSEYGGTNFYRHRSTGYEWIDGSRLQAYRDALDADLMATGLPQVRHLYEDGPVYEIAAHFDAVYNRMLIYSGRLLHCAVPGPTELLVEDPRRGRLTLNSFLIPRSGAQTIDVG